MDLRVNRQKQADRKQSPFASQSPRAQCRPAQGRARRGLLPIMARAVMAEQQQPAGTPGTPAAAASGIRAWRVRALKGRQQQGSRTMAAAALRRCVLVWLG